MTAPKPTVFIVDDDTDVCRSLSWLIESADLATQSFTSAASFLEAHDATRPGCLLLDLRMPEMGGLELQEELTRRQIDIPIIFVSAYADVLAAVAAMRAGAVTVIKKPYRDQVLLEYIREALEADADRRRQRSRRADIGKRIASLTPRQRQIMDMIVAGRATKQIAFHLGISPRTVEIHRAHIMAKMGADSIATLVRRVMTSRTP